VEDIADGAKPDRNVLTEYHGMGSATGAFMIRHKQYKYVYYVDYPPQLFDLASDPEELEDRAADDMMRSAVGHMRADLDRLDRVAHRFERIGRDALREAVGLPALVDRGAAHFRPPVPTVAHNCPLYPSPGPRGPRSPRIPSSA